MYGLKYLHLIPSVEDIENISKCGVYKIYHEREPELFYIGSSFASGKYRNLKGIYRRLLCHISRLRRNMHNSKKLQSLVNDFGIDGLRLVIIEICTDASQIKIREQYYLDLLCPPLNSSKRSIGNLGVRHSDESRAKRSISRNGMSLPQFVYDSMMKPIDQFNLNGVFIQTYSSTREASKLTSIDRGSINNTALGKRKSAGGFLWKYHNEAATVMGFCQSRLNKTI